MTVSATTATALGEAAGPARAERALRILDAASELLVAWGYRRVTVDEVARRAGVGKGTVYLHWRTKEALFLAVLLRAKSDALSHQTERIRADPREVLPSRMLRSMFLGMTDDPVSRAMYVGDSEVLGRLGEISARELRPLSDEGQRVLRRHLLMLRDAGAVRTDLAVEGQIHLYSSTVLGFLVLQPMGLPLVPSTLETGADTLAYTLRAALETGTGDPASAAAGIAAEYERLSELGRQEITRQLRR